MDNRFSSKRKLFACAHCGGPGSGCVGERYRVVDHIQKHHRALDQVPFYCKLCMFRCSTQDQYDRHLTIYKRHVTMAAMSEYKGDNSKYLVHNPNAKPVVEGVDYRAVLSEEPEQSVSNNSHSLTVVAEHCGAEELVTVKLPPSVLASLLSPSNNGQKMQTPVVPPALQYDPLKPGLTEAETSEFISGLLSMPSTSTSAVSVGRPAQQSLPVPGLETPLYKPTPIVPTQALRIPEVPTERSYTCTPAMSEHSAFSPLRTPEFFAQRVPSNAEENIMPQLLGDAADEQMVFSPPPVRASVKKLESTVTKPVNQPQPTKMTSQETQTEPEATVRFDSLAPLNAVLGHFEKTMEVAMGKVVFAVESVARATRHVQQSIDALGTSMAQISRSVDRLTDEQRRLVRSRESTSTSTSTSSQSAKRAREDDKENDRVLKSVVNKKSSSNRRT